MVPCDLFVIQLSLNLIRCNAPKYTGVNICGNYKFPLLGPLMAWVVPGVVDISFTGSLLSPFGFGLTLWYMLRFTGVM